jgi:hypothetical protein
MTCPSLPFALGLGVRSSSNLKVFEDADGHQLPMRRRKDADADGRADPICERIMRRQLNH